jgi:hypothetical protein
MKKAVLFLFILLLGISFISCKQNAGINPDNYSLSENLMGSEYVFLGEAQWDFNWAYSPIENDKDSGAYWSGKKQYFAGAWQSKEVGDDKYERSHCWFILFNNAPWFREMLREKWERIGPDNLTELVNNVATNLEPVLDEANLSQSNTDFVLNRIGYMDENLWLD